MLVFLGSDLVQLKEQLNKTMHDKDELKKAENEIEKLKRETVGNRNQLLQQIEELKLENSVLKKEVIKIVIKRSRNSTTGLTIFKHNESKQSK